MGPVLKVGIGLLLTSAWQTARRRPAATDGDQKSAIVRYPAVASRVRSKSSLLNVQSNSVNLSESPG